VKRNLFYFASLVLFLSVAAHARGRADNYSGSRYGVNPNSHSVDGYARKDGTYVSPYRATNPDNTQYNNYSTKGNTNPYTGKEGTVIPRK